MRFAEKIVLLVTIACFAVAFWAYPLLPQVIASHWDANGAVNGYLPSWSVFLMPAVVLLVLVLLVLIPRVEPRHKAIEAFRNDLDAFFIILSLVISVLFVQLYILWNFGKPLSPLATMPIALAAIFYQVGVMMEDSKRNYFVGVRTPWTLASDRVWEKTHAIAGKLFKAAGIIALLGLVFPKASLWLAIGPVLAVVAFLFVYSYVEFTKEGKPGKRASPAGQLRVSAKAKPKRSAKRKRR
ncbi:SdpI family protein [Candidatus Micrarchaeota archaeon]|nr:SdpI family protein [Candidatus Micrarchaeota archaeon]